MNHRLILIPAFIIALSLIGVGCKKVVKPESEKQHELWLSSLNDSIAKYQSLKDSISSELTKINFQIDELIGNFTHVSNPKQVEGYYILQGWQSRYPLTKTGIIARITENENIEVIAALSKGSFTHVSLSAGGQEYTSRPVPHDQTFNYKTSNLNTVCFTGGSADSIAMFIANHDADKIKLTFIENNTSGNFIIPDDEKNMITKTWTLFNTQRQSKTIAKEISLYSSKISSCRKLLNMNDSLNVQ